MSLSALVRIAEVVVVAGLAIVAWFTYRELQDARRAPVFLPNYEFATSNEPAKGPMVVARGTWIPESGPPEPLQTTTIECRRVRSDCVESAAIIEAVAGRGMLEASQTTFTIDRWTDREIVTEATQGPCGSRSLLIDLVNKCAVAKAAKRDESPRCAAAPERTLELVSGYKMRAEALRR